MTQFPFYSVFDLIGMCGFIIYVTNYAFLTFRVLTSGSLVYFWLNLSAATCVLIGLSVTFNLASAMIQLFWVAISLMGIIVRVVQPNDAR